MKTLADITDDTPLRLDRAAELAFSGGGMTASGLRREAARGRLVIERIAGKDFTTLGNIRRMRELCCVDHSRPICAEREQENAIAPESSSIAAGKIAQARLLKISAELKRSNSSSGPLRSPAAASGS